MTALCIIRLRRRSKSADKKAVPKPAPAGGFDLQVIWLELDKSEFGRIFACGRAAGENRAFRGCALSRSGHAAPAGGAPAGAARLLRTPTIACAMIKVRQLFLTFHDFLFF
jgi:hypothetical protein